MALSIQNERNLKWKLIGAILVLYAMYRIVTGYFGPVPVRINVNNGEIENIVVKIRIKGMQAPLKPGHAMITRYDLHEEVMLVKSNELIEFPRAYMWMALDPVEYSIEVYHPALYVAYKVVKFAELENINDIPITEIKASLISELIDNAKQEYGRATPQQQEFVKNHAKDQYQKYHLRHIENNYVPALKKAHQSHDKIYQQMKQLLIDCEKLFATFDYGKKCGLNNVSLRKSLGLNKDENYND